MNLEIFLTLVDLILAVQLLGGLVLEETRHIRIASAIKCVVVAISYRIARYSCDV